MELEIAMRFFVDRGEVFGWSIPSHKIVPIFVIKLSSLAAILRRILGLVLEGFHNPKTVQVWLVFGYNSYDGF